MIRTIDSVREREVIKISYRLGCVSYTETFEALMKTGIELSEALKIIGCIHSEILAAIKELNYG